MQIYVIYCDQFTMSLVRQVLLVTRNLSGKGFLYVTNYTENRFFCRGWSNLIYTSDMTVWVGTVGF